MRVALDARTVALPGIGRFLLGLWKGLLAEGVDVVGVWPTDPPDTWLMAQRATPPGPTIRTRWKPLRLAEQLAIPRVLGEAGASIVHAPHLPVPYLSRRPVVLTVHDLFPLRRRSNARSAVASAYYRAAFPTAVRKAARVVAVSASTAEELVSMLGVARARIDVIEHGIDLSTWRVPEPAEVDAVRTRFHLDEPFLLYVGTAKAHKNLRMLLEAQGASHPPLVIVGTTEEELAGVGAARSRVRALGRVSDDELRGLYAASTALLLPSWYEAVGFTALEAMACGTPVVSSNGGGLPDTVGDAAVTVDPHDVDGWRRAMARVVEDAALRDELVGRGLDRVRRRSWSDAARAYRAVYDAVVQ